MVVDWSQEAGWVGGGSSASEEVPPPGTSDPQQMERPESTTAGMGGEQVEGEEHLATGMLRDGKGKSEEALQRR